MEHSTDQAVEPSETLPPAELASALCAAQRRALEQRLEVEALLAEARSLEDRLANEVLHARVAAERAAAREHAAAAVVAAGCEREAIGRVEACAAELDELASKLAAVEGGAAAERATEAAAAQAVADCEERLRAAQTDLARAQTARGDHVAQGAALRASHAQAETNAASAAEALAEHRAVRRREELASDEAEKRAAALGAIDADGRPPSFEPVEELALLEARIALRSEAAKRAAERRASDAARNHVLHG